MDRTRPLLDAPADPVLASDDPIPVLPAGAGQCPPTCSGESSTAPVAGC